MAIRTAGEANVAPQQGVLARVLARVGSRRLDDALARGAPPETAAPLALRARRLTTLSRRRAIAVSLRRVIRDASRRVPPSPTRVSLRLSQVSAATDELTRLADTLVTPSPVSARGVAQALILLTDGTGPLYNEHSTANVRDCAADAADNLRLGGWLAGSSSHVDENSA